MVKVYDYDSNRPLPSFGDHEIAGSNPVETFPTFIFLHFIATMWRHKGSAQNTGMCLCMCTYGTQPKRKVKFTHFACLPFFALPHSNRDIKPHLMERERGWGRGWGRGWEAGRGPHLLVSISFPPKRFDLGHKKSHPHR